METGHRECKRHTWARLTGKLGKKEVATSLYTCLSCGQLKVGTHTIRISKSRLDMGSSPIKNLGAPTADADAVRNDHTHINRIGHTWAIPGEIKVPVGDTDFVVPFFVSLATGQTASLVKARYKINAGTSVTAKLQKNGVDITGFTSISVTTTAAETDPVDVALSDNDLLALVVTAVSGTPKNMSFTIFIEHTQ